MTIVKLGRYEVKSLLGKGAMGEVYCANDPMLNRDVAVKIILFPKKLHPEKLSELKKRFLMEAQLVARISHNGIVQIYDIGEQEGIPFVVLELISGRPLLELLGKKDNLDFNLAITIYHELLSAMAHAHEREIIHLDLKPANIMIEENGHIKIMDFGIARSMADFREKNIEIIGTPRYMAPEQISGEKILDQRTDVFALGIIFYLLISGRLPFPHTNFEQLHHAITEEPHPPLQTFKSDLPKPFYDFVNQALNKNPSDRFNNAALMLDAFKKCLEQTPQNEDLASSDKNTEKGRQEILNFILQRMQRKGEFPAMSQYVSEVISAARSEDSSAQKIAQSVLKDISLTNKILRMANSVYYKGHSEVTTISRAVVVLGANIILSLTSSAGIFEHFLKKSAVPELKEQAIKAMLSSLQAQEIAVHAGLENSEESMICSMLQHLGKLIVSFYFTEEYKAIEDLIKQGEKEENAFRQIMRLSSTELGQAIAESWNLPKLLQAGMVKLDLKHKGSLKTKVEKLQCVTSYASELSKASMIANESQRRIILKSLARKFKDRIHIKAKDLEKIIDTSLENAMDFSNTMKTNLKELGFNLKKENETEQNTTLDGRADSLGVDETIQQDSGSIKNEDSNFKDMMKRQEILTKTVSDITSSLTGKLSINEIIMVALEGMYRGLELHNVLLAMVTPKRDKILFKFGLGNDITDLTNSFAFPMISTSEAPVRSIKENQEIIISDFTKNFAGGSKFKKLFKKLNAKSITILPLTVKNRSIGLFLSMRSMEQEIITEMEVQNMRMLVNQVGLAFYQSVFNK